MDFEKLSPEERLVAEQAVLNMRALNDACDAAEDGKVLAMAEIMAVQQGREFIRQNLEMSMQRQADAVQKKGRSTVSANAD
tara:strand:- start:1116 stop:1358 length:243 start_codon:yes stop_codon:yes gene_type:complete